MAWDNGRAGYLLIRLHGTHDVAFISASSLRLHLLLALLLVTSMMNDEQRLPASGMRRSPLRSDDEGAGAAAYGDGWLVLDIGIIAVVAPFVADAAFA